MGQSHTYLERHTRIVERTTEAADEWVIRCGSMPTWDDIERTAQIPIHAMKNVFGLISSPIGIILERRLVISIDYAIKRGDSLIDQLVDFTGFYRNYLDVMPDTTLESLAAAWLVWLDLPDESEADHILWLARDTLKGMPLTDLEEVKAQINVILAS